MLKRLPVSVVAVLWLLLTPMMPHLHAHEFGLGSSGAVSGLHAAWAHDAPGPVDSEFIAEVEDPRRIGIAAPPAVVQPTFRLAIAAVAGRLTWTPFRPTLPRGPPHAAPQAPQAP